MAIRAEHRQLRPTRTTHIDRPLDVIGVRTPSASLLVPAVAHFERKHAMIRNITIATLSGAAVAAPPAFNGNAATEALGSTHPNANFTY